MGPPPDQDWTKPGPPPDTDATDLHEAWDFRFTNAGLLPSVLIGAIRVSSRFPHPHTGDSPDTRRTLAVDNFQTPGGRLQPPPDLAMQSKPRAFGWLHNAGISSELPRLGRASCRERV